ncbi:MAG: hypothetical protein U0031_21645 [Thermomicrobiales bacterium]
MPGRLASIVTATALTSATLVGFLAAPAFAQDATPVASPTVEAVVPRPAHIHSGSCTELGDVVAPLNDLTAPVGAPVGQADLAAIAETSFTTAPLTLDQMLGANHAINIHLSADQIQTYIACGEIGGIISPDGSLVIGLREQQGSGYTGIAFLAPGADGASTNVSVLIAPNFGAAG